MNNNNSHSDKHWELTPDMIQAYHAGTLSAEKMHWVEKQLLDDEFASDAFDGVSDVDTLSDILAELEQKIEERVEKEDSKVIPFRFKTWQIAASLSLLIVASYFIFNSLNPSKQTLALEEKTIQTPAESTQKSIPTATDEEEIAEIQTIEKSELQERKEQAKAKKTPSNLNTTSSAKPIIEPMEIVSIEMDDMTAEETEMAGVILEETADVEYKKEDNKQVSEALSGNVEGVQVSKEKAKSTRVKKRAQADKVETDDLTFRDAQDSRIITGKITGTDGTALPGVNVTVKGTSIGTTTDIDGFFKITGANEDDLLLISFIGLTSKEIKIDNSEILNIVLDEDLAALSEIVVTAQGIKREEHALGYTVTKVEMDDKENTYQSASPIGGTSAYKKYLQKNIRYPKIALEKEIEGRVKIIFYVEANGSLSHFEVKKGLGYGCDEEAIRLIKEGPEWSAAERGGRTYRQKASVTIRFKL